MANESRPLYKAVCASCGKQCEVPFKPSGDRPVYCRDCFRARSEGGTPKQGGASTAPSSSRPSSQGAPRPSDGLAAQVSAMNAKLDRLLSLAENAPSRPPARDSLARVGAPHISKPTGKKAASRKKPSARKR